MRQTVVIASPSRACLTAMLTCLLVLAGCSRAPDGSSAGASCVGPQLDDQPVDGRQNHPLRTLTPGGSITIYGHWYTTTCNDTGGHDPLRPMRAIRLTLTLPGGTPTDLGAFSPHGPDMGFSTVVDVPPGTPAGRATVRDDRPGSAGYEFQVGPVDGAIGGTPLSPAGAEAPRSADVTLAVKYTYGPGGVPPRLKLLAASHPCRAWNTSPWTIGLSITVEHVLLSRREAARALWALRRSRLVESVRVRTRSAFDRTPSAERPHLRPSEPTRCG